VIFLSDANFVGTYRLTNLEGRVISEGGINQASINVSNLASGIYMLTLTNENGFENSFKIVK
jgi:hypothetical protein